VASDTAVVTVSGTKVNAGADVVRCNKLPVTLSASNGYVSYKWFDLGSSSQTYSAVNDGCYWVEATDASGCTSFDTVCVSTSGVEGLHSHDTLNACSGGNQSFDASVNVNASGDSLVITFDATQDAQSSQLLGSPKVYMHSAPQFYTGAPWGTSIYTVGHWGLDDGLGEMDSVGPNKWQITIYPSCYYHYNPDTPLVGLWMVFRNANGTLQAPPSGGANINLLLGGVDSSLYAGVKASYKSTNNITYTWSNGPTTAISSFSASGTYYVTASDGSCSKIDTLSVNQNSSPSVSIGNDTCITSGNTVRLNTGGGFSTYVWNTGASTSSIIANLPGSYWVTVTDAAGCSGISDTVTISTGASVNLGPDTCIYSGGSYLLNAGAGATSYLWNTGATTDTLRVTATGTYSVVVTDGGCTGRDSIVIGSCNHFSNGCTADAYFRVLSISPSNTVTFKDSSYNLTDSVTYFWNFGDGSPVDTTGGGNQVYSYSQPGIYIVTLIVQNDSSTCKPDTMTRSVNVNYTGIAPISGLNEVNLYPNPASNNCTIDISATQSMNVNIEISNILGATVQIEKWQIVSGENKLLLDLTDFASGMYTVTIRSSAGTLTKKLDIIK
jgi:PKD repeat protein